MSRKVEIEMTVEDAKAVRAWQRAKDNLAEFDKQGKKTSKTFGNMVTDQVKGIAAAAAGFAGVGSVIGGIVTAAQLLRAEYDNLLQRQEKAANVQLPLAELERQLSHNMGGDQNAPIDQKLALQQAVLAERDRIVKEARTTPALATDAFSTVLSARGESSIKQGADATIAAMKIAPDAESVGFLAGGAMDLAKGGADPATAANWLAASGAELRLTKTPKIAKSVANAVNSGRGFGNDERQSLAMFSYMAGAANDTEGEPSTTALISLQKQLRKAVPTAPDSMAAIEQLAKDPKRQSEFLSGMNAEGRFLIPFENLIKDPAARQQVYGIRDRVPSFAKADQLAGDQKALLDALPTSSARNIAKGSDAVTESILSSDMGSISSILRDKIPALKQSYGAGSLATKLETLATEYDSRMGQNPVAALDSVISQLTATAEDFHDGIPALAPQTMTVEAPGGGFRTLTRPGREAVPATVREVQIGDAVLELVKMMREERPIIAAAVAAQNAPAPIPEIKLNLNNRPATADLRIPPPSGSRPHSRLNATPPGGRN